MYKLTIVLDYPEAERLWGLWAISENRIDFRRNQAAGDRCTTAYAAGELKYFLEKGCPDLQVAISGKRPESGPFIHLKIRPDDTGGGFELRPSEAGTAVLGDGRNGLLNGVYELLRIQGWRWLEPGTYGESAPEAPSLEFLRTARRVVPSFRYRMIDQYRESDDSVEFLQWQSRNRINAVFRKPATGKFADKLGMLSRRGGHLLQKLLNPDNFLEDGRTIWEAHPEWYGLPEDGRRQKETALRTQLCISQPGLIDYLQKKLLELLENEMSDIDIIDLWGFDTWGRNCHCEGCRSRGNGADQNLYLLSRLREYLNARLPRKVMMNTISYEGTVTMDPPVLPVPENLIAAGDLVIFYPISRCYRHSLEDTACPLNTAYRESLQGWHRCSAKLSLWGGEYYNVSKFEDLPLVFMHLIPQETRYYHRNGCSGMTYMHNLSPNWGVRALTQLLHTACSWNTDLDDRAFLEEYFHRKYGIHAEKLKRAYTLLEEGLAFISSWRNWRVGALDTLMAWDGGKPEKPFSIPHFENDESIRRTLEKCVAQLDEAEHILRECLQCEQKQNWKNLPDAKDIPPLITPLELEKIRFYDTMEYRLGEDLRGIIYGADTIRLLWLLLKYHDALLHDGNGDAIWNEIEHCAAKMSDYYIPVTYENPTPGVHIKDALSRTQLRMLITRCRGRRIQKKETRP